MISNREVTGWVFCATFSMHNVVSMACALFLSGILPHGRGVADAEFSDVGVLVRVHEIHEKLVEAAKAHTGAAATLAGLLEGGDPNVFVDVMGEG